jgi:hypothetical protein
MQVTYRFKLKARRDPLHPNDETDMNAEVSDHFQAHPELLKLSFWVSDGVYNFAETWDVDIKFRKNQDTHVKIYVTRNFQTNASEQTEEAIASGVINVLQKPFAAYCLTLKSRGAVFKAIPAQRN